MALKIINKSQWPTPALNIIVRWVCRREKLGTKQHPYTVKVSDARKCAWYGDGGRYGQRIHIARRHGNVWPQVKKDRRLKDASEHSLNSPMEILVYLLAHEAYHATGGHPGQYRKPDGGKVDKQMMEWDCNHVAMRAVESFRAEWPTIRGAIYAAMRAERNKKHAKHERRADPSPKLVAAETALEKWRRKLKLAQTKIRKYQRKVKYYGGLVAAKSKEAK